MQKTQLIQASDFDSLWQAHLRDELKQVSAQSWKSLLPSLVLVPSRSWGFLIRDRLLEVAPGCAGVAFWTPGQFWGSVFNQATTIPDRLSQENHQLLLAACAESIPDEPLARAVAADPGALFRCMDSLETAGHNPADCFPSPIKDLITQTGKVFHSLSRFTEPEAERALLEQIETQQWEPLFDAVFMVGFGPEHWRQTNLLQAAARLAKKSTLTFTANPTEPQQSQQDWIRFWNRQCEQVVIPPTSTTDTPEIQVRIGYDLREQVQAIIAQAMEYLADPDCNRLGIVFPGSGPLARETAAQLTHLEIPHYDTLGFTNPLSEEEKAWSVWIELQRRWTINSLLQLIRSHPAFESLNNEHTVKILDRAFSDVMIDDLAVIVEYLKQTECPASQHFASELEQWPRLPEQGTLQEFLAIASGSLGRLGSASRVREVELKAEGLNQELTLPFSRDLFLDWLEEVSAQYRRTRNKEGNHPFARVHLLRYSHAAGLPWTHLVLAGLNENGWPPPFESSGFLPDHELDQLNEQVRKSWKDSSKTGRGLLLSSRERRELSEEAFKNLYSAASKCVCATASLTDESEPGTQLPPSQYLVHLAHIYKNEILTDDRLHSLKEVTASWLAPAESLFQPPETPAHADIDQVRIAYTARRDESTVLGKYDFCLDSPPRLPVRLSCKNWESALRNPALTWLGNVLGVSPAPDTSDRWALTTGTWVHGWLSSAIRQKGSGKIGFLPFPGAATLLEKLETQISSTRNRVDAAYQAAGRSLPVWWESGWNNARLITLRLADTLLKIEGWPFLSSEHKLPNDLSIELPSKRVLYLTGRLDLLLTRHHVTEWNMNGDLFTESDTPCELKSVLGDKPAWIIDFKTGTAPSITPQKMLSGEGVQLGLYALALSQLGGSEIFLSVAAPNDPVKPTEISEALEQLLPLWETLAIMQDSGRFGMLGEIRPEFGYSSPYPLATLEIDPAILETRWWLTHPLLKEAQA